MHAGRAVAPVNHRKIDLYAAFAGAEILVGSDCAEDVMSLLVSLVVPYESDQWRLPRKVNSIGLRPLSLRAARYISAFFSPEPDIDYFFVVVGDFHLADPVVIGHVKVFALTA